MPSTDFGDSSAPFSSGRSSSLTPARFSVERMSSGGDGASVDGGVESAAPPVAAGTSRQRTLSFFRSIMSRTADYDRSNHVLVQDGTPVVLNGPYGGSNPHAIQLNTPPVVAPAPKVSPLEGSLWLVFARIIYSRWWKIILITFTVVLLFGSQIRDIWLPKSWDTAADTLLLLTFCVFMSDIGMRCYTEPFYFAFHFGKKYHFRHQYQIRMQQALQAELLKKQQMIDEQRRREEQERLMLEGDQNQQQRGYHDGQNKLDVQKPTDVDLPTGSRGATAGNSVPGGCSFFGIGSFLFWCDVMSTLTLLFDISFIAPRLFRQLELHIELDPFGIPVRIILEQSLN
jgi:hypothetical protein